MRSAESSWRILAGGGQETAAVGPQFLAELCVFAPFPPFLTPVSSLCLGFRKHLLALYCLSSLHVTTGGDWVKIGHQMGRSNLAVRDRYREIVKRNVRRGRWTQEEQTALVELVHHHTGTAVGTLVDHGVPWDAIGAQHPTRNSRQCRQKWFKEVNCKNQDDNEAWSAKHDNLLVQRLFSLLLVVPGTAKITHLLDHLIRLIPWCLSCSYMCICIPTHYTSHIHTHATQSNCAAA